MHRTAVFLVSTMLLAGLVAHAQDIVGIEDCTKAGGLDKRIGCFQSNIDYLKKLVTKDTGDLHQRLAAANAEVAELKRTTASLRGDVASLQAAISKLQAAIDELRQAAKKPDSKEGK